MVTNSRLTGVPEPSLLGNQQAGQEAGPPRALQEETSAWVETHSGPQDLVHSCDLCAGVLPSSLFFLTTEFWGA